MSPSAPPHYASVLDASLMSECSELERLHAFGLLSSRRCPGMTLHVLPTQSAFADTNVPCKARFPRSAPNQYATNSALALAASLPPYVVSAQPLYEAAVFDAVDWLVPTYVRACNTQRAEDASSFWKVFNLLVFSWRELVPWLQDDPSAEHTLRSRLLAAAASMNVISIPPARSVRPWTADFAWYPLGDRWPLASMASHNYVLARRSSGVFFF
ncbi:hypothetical protein DFP72DRAFT_1081945 [Ephemerocybe angulata]|uniref:Uncharacterized protein n=1 Tax=Ephemerocybe angulata TaxID=980116 RepID=A0A8H6H8M0_9AGAR|nr:hypothetical protein DFP72DRAFT_1081945 [Tulosesus angulatus]